MQKMVTKNEKKLETTAVVLQTWVENNQILLPSLPLSTDMCTKSVNTLTGFSNIIFMHTQNIR